MWGMDNVVVSSISSMRVQRLFLFVLYPHVVIVVMLTFVTVAYVNYNRVTSNNSGCGDSINASEVGGGSGDDVRDVAVYMACLMIAAFDDIRCNCIQS